MNKSKLLLAVFLLSLSAAAIAQNDQTPAKPNPEQRLRIETFKSGTDFFYTEMALSDETITGAPYTATAVTESTQLLADGNRIVNKRSAFVARDGQGRTRREQALGELGSLSAKGPNMVFILDPVTHTDYILNVDEQSARVVKREGRRSGLAEEKIRLGRAAEERGRKERVEREVRESPEESTHETLPNQVIEGVNCEGRRETRTIPAGALGNEKPIQIVSETWTSPELHVLVMRKRSDPRLGETVYRLTDIKRGEPDASLFQVPSGYKTTTVTEPLPPRE